ncbi:hypothetical protein ZWY2020_045995 [Hordeum vulgare]|nr:hypothetical protein ZWY2020_045995 [Hordeum vulgare]
MQRVKARVSRSGWEGSTGRVTTTAVMGFFAAGIQRNRERCKVERAQKEGRKINRDGEVEEQHLGNLLLSPRADGASWVLGHGSNTALDPDRGREETQTRGEAAPWLRDEVQGRGPAAPTRRQGGDGGGATDDELRASMAETEEATSMKKGMGRRRGDGARGLDLIGQQGGATAPAGELLLLASSWKSSRRRAARSYQRPRLRRLDARNLHARWLQALDASVASGWSARALLMRLRGLSCLVRGWEDGCG